ncbi:MAG: hypothetical protein ABIK15_13080 [Pseudomonadota bacterium]
MKKTIYLVLAIFVSYFFYSQSLLAGNSDAEPKPVTNNIPLTSETVEPTIAIPKPIQVDVLAEAEALLDSEGLANCKKALEICLIEVQNNPDSYRANWLCAWAYRESGNEIKKSEQEGWEKACAEYGKKGMEYAEKAIKLDPKSPEGHYWYGSSVGIYADGVSVFTVLREGLKEKTQKGFETAYKLDRNYHKGSPMIALGRFWQVLPWPLNDEEKAVQYYREFQKTEYYNDPNTIEFNIYFAELLIDDRKTRNEAKILLENVLKISKHPYWVKLANGLLAKL